jgi:hypothetical protein
MPRVRIMTEGEFERWFHSDNYPDHWRPAAPYEHKFVVDYAIDVFD